MVKGQGTKAAMKICTGLGGLVDFWRKVRAYKNLFVGMPSMIKIRFYGHLKDFNYRMCIGVSMEWIDILCVVPRPVTILLMILFSLCVPSAACSVNPCGP